MLFSSLEFILFFLPLVLSCYFLLPRKAQNWWLLLASLFFYAWGEPKFVLVMLFSIVFNYLTAIRIENLKDHRVEQKVMLAVVVAVNLGILLVFKYLNFITETLHNWFPGTEELFPATQIALPIGISFFTFQALSYIIDVYRGTPAQKSIGNLGLYISFFPQLIAGPIVRYGTVMSQITDRHVTVRSFSRGVFRFLLGFNKKILLANTLAEVADRAFGTAGSSVCMAWLGVLCYALQIYFDFSGYSDMAIGLGRMFGFRFLENFDYPYLSKTFSDFWRRWHISLGAWFRDYVYIPLGGSRVGKGRHILNLAVVWLLTGIWHGANWTFLAWGILHGVMVIMEAATGLQEQRETWNVGLKGAYRAFVILIVMLGWVLFRSDSLSAAWLYVREMFGAAGNRFVDADFWFCFREYIVYLIFGVICATPLLTWGRKQLDKRIHSLGEAVQSLGYAVQLILFVFSMSFLVISAHNPFIYFNF